MTSDRPEPTPAEPSTGEPAALASGAGNAESGLPEALPQWRPHASKSTTAVITLALAAVGTALYLSPVGGHAADAPAAAGLRQPGRASLYPAPGTAARTSTGASIQNRAGGHSTPGGHSSGGRVTPVVYRTPYGTKIVYVPVRYGAGTGGGPTSTGSKSGGSSTLNSSHGSSKTGSSSTTPKPKRLWCTDFRWQQDAQAAYLANLSDPYGLDGAAGPHNGDGLACTELPVDPSRPQSTPVDAYTPPAPAQASMLAKPAAKYFGVAQDGLPGDTPLLNGIATQVGKAPSAVAWFTYFDQAYPTNQVQAAWSRGALPVITWMTLSSTKSDPNLGKYTLANIISGRFDHYLLSYAGSIMRTGLPVVIRWDHEMNGNWMPWSAGLPGHEGASGQPNLYVQAWRHIHDLFDSVGANSDVIWLWSPVRIDNVRPHSSTSGYKYETSLAEDYPGDAYVDWVGMSAYQYKPSDGWTFESTFRATLDGLKAICPKPIFVSETGATESVGTTDYATQKAQWITDTLHGLANDPQVVGFSWFNNTVNDVHMVDGQLIQTDWQFSSSPEALAAFKSGISDPTYSSGVMPDLTGGTK